MAHTAAYTCSMVATPRYAPCMASDGIWHMQAEGMGVSTASAPGPSTGAKGKGKGGAAKAGTREWPAGIPNSHCYAMPEGASFWACALGHLPRALHASQIDQWTPAVYMALISSPHSLHGLHEHVLSYLTAHSLML
jgi:hypothetical protein